MLILGSRGMLGHALADAFADREPVRYDLAELDITDATAVGKAVQTLRPLVILNAAAITNVDWCEEHEEEATTVNAAAVGTIAGEARTIGALLVHYSTDYVFNGARKEGYSEDDAPAPLSAYGRSKYRGEQALAASGCRFLLIRTAWLYGPFGKNFVDTILTKAENGEALQVVDDQFGSPTYTRDLAAHTRTLVAQGAAGIHHATNSGSTSWFGFAQKALALAHCPVVLTAQTSVQLARPAPRPSYSILRATKDAPLRSWEEALVDYLAERAAQQVR